MRGQTQILQPQQIPLVIAAGTRSRKCRSLYGVLARCLLLFVAVVSSSSLRAQPGFRDLTGTVSQDHEPLRGAVVQVENESTNSVISYVTDRSGQYSFKRLSVDTDYRITVVYRGHRTPTKELSHFDKKVMKVIDFEVKGE